MLIAVTRLTMVIAVGGIVAWQTSGSAREPLPHAATAPPTLSPTIPSDFATSATQADAVTFAWQSFVAVNWPAMANVRGVPDTTKTIGQAGEVVWNTWKATEEIFLPGAQTPVSWNQYGPLMPPSCTAAGAKPSDYTIRRVTKVVGGTNSPVLQTERQVVGGTLTDQHGNIARYDVRVNQTIFDAIVAKQLYNRAVQDQVKKITLPTGVMEVKASWRMMTPADTGAIKSRYFRRIAWVYTPPADSQPATCASAEVGLVGLHISQKTPNRPAWAWATFEQIDNVPQFGAKTPVAGGQLPYSFNNPACADTVCVPNKSTEKPKGHPTGIPTQVTRRINIGTEAQAANPQWQQALASAVPGSPFAYYQLVDIQWKASANAQPAPFLLGNAVLETYVARSSCLNCHFVAKTASGKTSSDYSYILAEAQLPPSARRVVR